MQNRSSARERRVRTFPPAHDLTIFVLHLHLGPLVLPITLRGAKLVTFLHGVECWKRVRLLQKAALLRSSVLIACSQYTKERFTSCNPAFVEQDIQVCHPGTHNELRTVAHAERPGAFALIVGRMDSRERYKGHDLLLELWSNLVSEVPGLGPSSWERVTIFRGCSSKHRRLGWRM